MIERRWMLFVDGENFTKRGQEVLKANNVKPDSEFWLRDVYIWFPLTAATSPFLSHWEPHFKSDPGPIPPRAPAATRSYFYTSMPYESQQAVTAARLALRSMGFEPRMFPRTKGKSKAVDLALATDCLTLAGEDRYDVAVLIAGDGDYVPVVEALKRLGRHVVVAFFAEEGLSDELRIAADDFVNVTNHFVSRWKQLYTRRAQAAASAEKAAARAAENAAEAAALAADGGVVEESFEAEP